MEVFEYLLGKHSGGGGQSNNIGVKAFIDNYHTNLDATYNKKYDTTEQVNIYSPKTGFDWYFIFKINNGKYRVHWKNSSTPIVQTNETSMSISVSGLSFDSVKFYESSKKTTSYNNKFTINTAGNLNYVAEFDTLEEAIEALQTSTTTYSTATYYSTGIRYDNNGTNTPCVMTNSIEIGYTGIINECGRQLSSNEVINYIA